MPPPGRRPCSCSSFRTLDTQLRRVPGALLRAYVVFAAFEEDQLLKALVEQGDYPKGLLDFVVQMEVKAVAKLHMTSYV